MYFYPGGKHEADTVLAAPSKGGMRFAQILEPPNAQERGGGDLVRGLRLLRESEHAARDGSHGDVSFRKDVQVQALD